MMAREEAERLVTRLVRVTEVRVATIHEKKYIAAKEESKELRHRLIAALCTPDAELLDTCKRLYDICYFLTEREVIELGDDAMIASDLWASREKLADSTERINLDWAKEVIAKTEPQ